MKLKLFLFLTFFLLATPFLAQSSDNIEFSSLANKKYAHVLVEKVISADTIRLESGEKIKLIGLKAPRPPKREKVEMDKNGFIVEPEDSNPSTSVEEDAFNFTKSLIEGKYVRLEFDAQRTTSTLETFAYVYLDDLFVNAEILKQGFANLQIAAPNLKYSDLFRAAYREARTEKRGLHNE